MGQIILPDNIATLTKDSGTQLSMAATYLGQPTRIQVGGQQYRATSQITVDLTTTGANGLDTGSLAADTLYHVYAVQSAGSLALVASTSDISTGPSGFSAWKEVGRFRTFQGSAAVAEPANLVLGSKAANTITPWESFSPTGSNIPPIDQEDATRRRVGENMEIDWKIRATGAGSSGVLALNIPNGLSSDAPGNSHSGGANFLDISVNEYFGGNATNPNSTEIRFIFEDYASAGNRFRLAGDDFANSDQFTTTIFVPIREYKGLFD